MTTVLPSTLTIRPLTEEQHRKLRRKTGRKWWDASLAMAAGISVKTLHQVHPDTRMDILAAVMPYKCTVEGVDGFEIPACWLPEPTAKI